MTFPPPSAAKPAPLRQQARRLARSLAMGALGIWLAAVPTISSAQTAEKTPVSVEERRKKRDADIKRILEERKKKLDEESAARKKDETALKTAADAMDKDKTGAAPAAAAAAGEAGGTPPGAPPPPGAAPAAAKGDAPAERPLAPSTITANASLVMSPLDCLATVGKRFSVRVMANDASNQRADSVRIALRYDPRFIAPIKVYDDKVRGALKGRGRLEDRPEAGLLYYEADFKQPIVINQRVFLTIVWEALRPTEFTEIAFEMAEDGPHTSLLADGRDLLGLMEDPFDGVISASVLILPDGDPERNATLQGKKEELATLQAVTKNPPGYAGFRLEGPRGGAVAEGTDFEVGIVLNNPDALNIDTVSLQLRFDPKVLQVIDTDKGNTIKRGVNIQDGEFRSVFPFDIFVQNSVQNVRGYIDYRMGSSRGAAFPTHRMATIRFRAIAPAAESCIEVFTKDDSGAPGSALTFYGKDYLDAGPRRSTPLLCVKVLPADSPTGASTSGEAASLRSTAARKNATAAPAGASR